MIGAEHAGILIQTSETSGLVVWLDILQLNNFGSGKSIGELDGISLLDLILNDLLNVLLNSKTLIQTFVELVTLKRVLIATYKNVNKYFSLTNDSLVSSGMVDIIVSSRDPILQVGLQLIEFHGSTLHL